MALASPTPLRRELERAFPERPFRAECWGGSALPATSDGPLFRVRSPSAVAHALRAPGQLGLGRAYVAGGPEGGGLDAGGGLLDTWKPPAVERRERARIALAAVRAA